MPEWARSRLLLQANDSVATRLACGDPLNLRPPRIDSDAPLVVVRIAVADDRY